MQDLAVEVETAKPDYIEAENQVSFDNENIMAAKDLVTKQITESDVVAESSNEIVEDIEESKVVQDTAFEVEQPTEKIVEEHEVANNKAEEVTKEVDNVIQDKEETAFVKGLVESKLNVEPQDDVEVVTESAMENSISKALESTGITSTNDVTDTVSSQKVDDALEALDRESEDVDAQIQKIKMMMETPRIEQDVGQSNVVDETTVVPQEISRETIDVIESPIPPQEIAQDIAETEVSQEISRDAFVPETEIPQEIVAETEFVDASASAETVDLIDEAKDQVVDSDYKQIINEPELTKEIVNDEDVEAESKNAISKGSAPFENAEQNEVVLESKEVGAEFVTAGSRSFTLNDQDIAVESEQGALEFSANEINTDFVDDKEIQAEEVALDQIKDDKIVGDISNSLKAESALVESALEESTANQLESENTYQALEQGQIESKESLDVAQEKLHDTEIPFETAEFQETDTLLDTAAVKLNENEIPLDTAEVQLDENKSSLDDSAEQPLRAQDFDIKEAENIDEANAIEESEESTLSQEIDFGSKIVNIEPTVDTLPAETEPQAIETTDTAEIVSPEQLLNESEQVVESNRETIVESPIDSITETQPQAIESTEAAAIVSSEQQLNESEQVVESRRDIVVESPTEGLTETVEELPAQEVVYAAEPDIKSEASDGGFLHDRSAFMANLASTTSTTLEEHNEPQDVVNAIETNMTENIKEPESEMDTADEILETTTANSLAQEALPIIASTPLVEKAATLDRDVVDLETNEFQQETATPAPTLEEPMATTDKNVVSDVAAEQEPNAFLESIIPATIESQVKDLESTITAAPIVEDILAEKGNGFDAEVVSTPLLASENEIEEDTPVVAPQQDTVEDEVLHQEDNEVAPTSSTVEEPILETLTSKKSVAENLETERAVEDITSVIEENSQPQLQDESQESFKFSSETGRDLISENMAATESDIQVENNQVVDEIEDKVESLIKLDSQNITEDDVLSTTTPAPIVATDRAVDLNTEAPTEEAGEILDSSAPVSILKESENSNDVALKEHISEPINEENPDPIEGVNDYAQEKIESIGQEMWVGSESAQVVSEAVDSIESNRLPVEDSIDIKESTSLVSDKVNVELEQLDAPIDRQTHISEPVGEHVLDQDEPVLEKSDIDQTLESKEDEIITALVAPEPESIDKTPSVIGQLKLILEEISNEKQDLIVEEQVTEVVTDEITETPTKVLDTTTALHADEIVEQTTQTPQKPLETLVEENEVVSENVELIEKSSTNLVQDTQQTLESQASKLVNETTKDVKEIKSQVPFIN